MAKWGKRLFCIAFSFMFSFMVIGYAALTDTLMVSGTTNLTEPNALYIVKIEAVGSNGNATAGDYTEVFPTNVSSTISVGKYNRNTPNTITYKITVKNNTRYKYSYVGIEYEKNANNNSYLDTKNYLTIETNDTQNGSGGTFNTSDYVEPGETKVFYAKYTMGSSLYSNSNTSKKSFTTFVNYKFRIHVDALGDIAAERIIKKFGEILNTQSTYQDLITHIDDKYVNQGWQSNYIGNVVGSSSADTATIERLFGDELVLTVDGQEVRVTVMIKRTDVDDNANTGDKYTAVNGNNSHTEEGCEMTLYITTNDLDKVIDAGEYSGNRNMADVYIAVFTCDKKADGTYTDWYHIGGIYEGIAPIVAYDGSTDSTGSFITDDWKPLKTTYQVTGNYSYTINEGNGRDDGREDIRDIMAAKDTAAVTEFNRLFALAKEASAYIDANFDYFNQDVFQEHIVKLRNYIKEAEAMTVNNNTRRVEIIQIMQKLENATYPFLSYLQ